MRGKKVKFKVYDPLESRYEAAVKSDNFHCENAAESQINETNEFSDKYHNFIYYKYTHLSGLQKRASRQLMLRTGRNFIQKVHYEVEVIVKNSYDYPYGVNLKMQNTGKMIDEFYRKGFYPKNTVQGRNKGGNITLNINDTNNVNNQKQSEEKKEQSKKKKSVNEDVKNEIEIEAINSFKYYVNNISLKIRNKTIFSKT